MVAIDKGANSDWIKMSWDISSVNSVDELRELLRDIGISVDEFKKLPIYWLNIDKILWLKEL